MLVHPTLVAILARPYVLPPAAGSEQHLHGQIQEDPTSALYARIALNGESGRLLTGISWATAIMRTHVLSDLLLSEEAYLQELKIIVDVYLVPTLRMHPRPISPLTSADPPRMDRQAHPHCRAALFDLRQHSPPLLLPHRPSRTPTESPQPQHAGAVLLPSEPVHASILSVPTYAFSSECDLSLKLDQRITRTPPKASPARWQILPSAPSTRFALSCLLYRRSCRSKADMLRCRPLS